MTIHWGSGHSGHPAPSGEPDAEAEQQPWLHDLVVALAAPTQLWCGPDGLVRPGGAQGLYTGDVRALSRVEVEIGGRPLSPVRVTAQTADSLLAVAVARHLGDALPDPTVRVDRRTHVFPDRIEEQLTVVSAAREPVQTDVRLLLATDLATMDAVKSGASGTPASPTVDGPRVSWTAPDGFTVRVSGEGARAEAADDHVALIWDVDLTADSSTALSWRVEVHDPAAVLVAASASTSAQSWRPEVRADDRRLARWVDRSVRDLQALRMATAESPDSAFLAAGAPWYLTLFGRDSLWAARMLLPLGTELAATTLRVLAARQGTAVDPDTAEQPGKILHEVRREAQSLPTDTGGGLQLPPVYYGTIDATPLWVCLLHDAWRWGLPAEQVEPLLPALEAALAWMSDFGDSDGDGLLEYVDTSGRGLSNQGWKDSHDSVRWRDGSLATPPIALCEPQGYAHEAAVGGAALLSAFGRPGADRWLSWAERLRDRFRSSFWVEDADGAYPAIALDADKRAVDSLTSNAGHLLGTGLLNPAEETTVAERMVSARMSSGFGLRTLAAGSGGFSPLSYHGGSVWPHDTAIVMTGLARSGHGIQAAVLLEGLLAAAEAFDNRLPELFGGDTAAEVTAPVPYPAACRPQAWSAASAVAALDVALGLRPDVPAGSLTWSPLAPSPVGALSVSGLRVAGAPVSAEVGADGAPGALEGVRLARR